MADVGNTGSVADIQRRLQRVEDKLDERTATVDMVRSAEAASAERVGAVKALFEAREVAHAAEITGLKDRIGKLESANSKMLWAIVVAFLGLIVQILSQVLSTGGPR